MISSIEFRLTRRFYPWLSLMATVCRIMGCRGSQQTKEKLRFWKLLVKVDFANLLAIGMDMIQPEYWLL